MAYSETVSQTPFNTRRVIDRAFGRCRILAEQISAEQLQTAKDNLYLMLSDWANNGAPLWCIQKTLLGLNEGVDGLLMFAGTVDVLNSSLRSMTEVTGTDTDTATQRTVEFDEATAVSTIGIKWSATASPIELARSDDGATWTVIQTETPDAGNGDWSWYDLDSVVEALYFRVRATTGNLDFDEIYLGNTPSEIPLGRLNRDDYTNLPNKTYTGDRPLQFWLDRQAAAPIMRLWPVPNATAEHSLIVAWVHRHIMDVGTLTQDVEVPQRWLEAVIAGLAAKIALEVPEVPLQMVPMLDQKAAQALYTAQQEERDNSPISLMPNFSCYTR